MIAKALCIALSTYSVIPVPQYEWNERSSKYAIALFPVVGVVSGFLQWLWLRFCHFFDISAVLYAALAAVLPLLITGGIHIDGYMDTVDALASHQPKEKKLAIMKDSHCGAFAVMYVCAYMLISAAVLYELYIREMSIFIVFVYVLSRAFSGLCAVNLPNARKEGMLAAMTKNAERGKINIILAFVVLFAFSLLFCADFRVCISCMTCAVFFVAYYIHMVKKQFGGVTGDTAGYFLQMCELVLFLAILLGGLER